MARPLLLLSRQGFNHMFLILQFAVDGQDDLAVVPWGSPKGITCTCLELSSMTTLRSDTQEQLPGNCP